MIAICRLNTKIGILTVLAVYLRQVHRRHYWSQISLVNNKLIMLQSIMRIIATINQIRIRFGT